MKPLGPRALQLYSALPGSSHSVLVPDHSLSLQHQISWDCLEEWLISRFPQEKLIINHKCDKNQDWENYNGVLWWWESKDHLRASQFSLLLWGWGRAVQGWQRITSARVCHSDGSRVEAGWHPVLSSQFITLAVSQKEWSPSPYVLSLFSLWATERPHALMQSLSLRPPCAVPLSETSDGPVFKCGFKLSSCW